jgi:HEAT repeat protein
VTHALRLSLVLLAACGESKKPLAWAETDPTTELVLAAGKSSDPRLVAAALEQAAVAEDRRWRLHPEAGPIILTHLASADAAVRAAAVDASRQLMIEERVEQTATRAWISAGHQEVKGSLCRIATDDPLAPTRVRAIQALSHLYNHADDPQVAAALFAALSDGDAAVVSTALGRLVDEGYRLPHRPRFVEAATRLLGHADPGVRGRAALLLAGVARAERVGASAAAAIEPLLADPHPFVRAAAATAIARLGATGALAKLLPLLDDPGEARYELGAIVHVVPWGFARRRDGPRGHRVPERRGDAQARARAFPRPRRRAGARPAVVRNHGTGRLTGDDEQQRSRPGRWPHPAEIVCPQPLCEEGALLQRARGLLANPIRTLSHRSASHRAPRGGHKAGPGG